MLCPACGESQADGGQFCAACGRPLSSGTQAEIGSQKALTTRLRLNWRRAGAPSAETKQTPGDRHRGIRMNAPIDGSTAAIGLACRVCGSIVPYRRRVCGVCGTPPGMVVDPFDPFAATFVMPATTSQSRSELQAAVTKPAKAAWNWGAAFVTYLWAISHKVWWYVAAQSLCIVALITSVVVSGSYAMSPLVNALLVVELIAWIPLRLYFGLRGTALACRARRFKDSAHCLYVQDLWRPFGIAASALELVILTGVIILLLIGGAASADTSRHAPNWTDRVARVVACNAPKGTT